MKLRNYFSILLFVTLIVVFPVGAGGISEEYRSLFEEDNKITKQELTNAIISYMLNRGGLKLEELRDAAHVYVYWSGEPLKFTDSANRQVTLYKPAKRVVPYPITLYEPIWILGAQNKVVGVRDEAIRLDYPWLPGIQEKENIGDMTNINWEKIVELDPDVMIVASRRGAAEAEEKLSRFNITIVALRFMESEKFKDEFRILSKILGNDKKAEEFISWWEEKSNILNRAIGIEQKVRVFAEYTDLEYSTGGEGSGIHSTINMAGGYNIALDANVGYYGEVDPEWLMNQTIDVILLVAWLGETGYSIQNEQGLNTLIQEKSARTAVENSSAVRNGKVYVIDGPAVLTSVRNNILALYCAKWFYPGLFNDLNPDEIHREYFERWIGVQYRGIWAYPLV